nr:LysR family transcriptional regulator [Streptomyces antimycoticus]
MDVELRHLRAFVSVARHRSFSRAAEELLITQPALSRSRTVGRQSQCPPARPVLTARRTDRHGSGVPRPRRAGAGDHGPSPHRSRPPCHAAARLQLAPARPLGPADPRPLRGEDRRFGRPDPDRPSPRRAASAERRHRRDPRRHRCATRGTYRASVRRTARRRTRHPAVRFVPLTPAPASPVSLVHFPDARRTLIRRFLEAAVQGAAPA